MEKVFVAQTVAKKLVSTEAAVDGAMAEAAELMSVMLAARKDVKAPLNFADDAQVKLMDAMKALSEARTAMVAVHDELNEARLRLGLRTTMILPEEVPSHFGLAPAAPQLREVG